MKKVSGTLKLDQAQFRELEAFAKFGSDLDAATKLVIERGRRNTEMLKQKQFSPVEVEKQVAIIYATTNGITDNVPTEKMKEYEQSYLSILEQNHRKTLDELRAGKYTPEQTDVLEKVAKEVAKTYNVTAKA